MTPRLRRALREHFARFRLATYDGKRSPWVFHHPYRRRRAKAGDRIGSLRRSFTAACKRAEIPKEFHAHDLRHRRVTTWLADGKSAVLVKEAVGHADLKTTMGYTHLAKEHLRALVEDSDICKDEPGSAKRLHGSHLAKSNQHVLQCDYAFAQQRGYTQSAAQSKPVERR